MIGDIRSGQQAKPRPNVPKVPKEMKELQQCQKLFGQLKKR